MKCRQVFIVIDYQLCFPLLACPLNNQIDYFGFKLVKDYSANDEICNTLPTILEHNRYFNMIDLTTALAPIKLFLISIYVNT